MNRFQGREHHDDCDVLSDDDDDDDEDDEDNGDYNYNDDEE